MAGKTASNAKAKVTQPKASKPSTAGVKAKVTTKTTVPDNSKALAAAEARVKELEDLLRQLGFGHKV